MIAKITSLTYVESATELGMKEVKRSPSEFVLGLCLDSEAHVKEDDQAGERGHVVGGKEYALPAATKARRSSPLPAHCESSLPSC